MLNRRELIASTVGLSLATTLVAARPTASAEGGDAGTGEVRRNLEKIPVAFFVASKDLPAAQLAAQEAEARGAEILWLDADVTPVYTRLDLALRPTAFAVAGLTSAHHLFVLERLGWDRGLRTVRRAELGTAVEWRLEPKLYFVPGT
jgi:hypothetical protein